MTDWAPNLVALLGAGGLGAILLELIKRALDTFSGRGRQRRDEVDRAWQRADAETDRADRESNRADREAVKRRIAEEYASRSMRQLIAAPCVDTADIEPFPTYPKD